MHVHAACLEEPDNGCYISPDLKDSYKFDIYLKSFGTSKKELQQKGSGLVVQRLQAYIKSSKHTKQVVLLALDGVYDPNGKWNKKLTFLKVSNKYIYENIKGKPEFIFGASVHPNRKNALELLEYWAARGAKLIKWIPSLHRIDPSNELYRPYYQKMKDLGLLLLTHTGDEHAFGDVDDSLADPLNLKLPLEMGVTVIAAHTAIVGERDGESNFSRLRRMLLIFPNLYADISSATQINHYGAPDLVFRDKEIRHKLLYGSDYPLINTPLTSPWWYVFRFGWKETQRISSINNPLDRDYQMKLAFGMPELNSFEELMK
jgi:hypothetical protein